MDSIGTLILEAAASAIAAAQETQESNPHQANTRRADDTTASAFDTLVSVVKRTVYFLIVTGTLLVLSLLSFATIYSLSMPRFDVRRPVHFDYNFNPDRHMSGAYGKHLTRSSTLGLSSERTSCDSDDGANGDLSTDCVEDDKIEDGKNGSGTQLQGPREKRYRDRAPPTAVVDLLVRHTQWHAYTDDVLPSHSLNPLKHVLKPKNRYYIDCSLVLPETDMNKQLGIFMLEIDLLASDGTLLASSERSAMLPHESFMISAARKLVLLGPILIGAVPEARTVVLECFDSFVESADKSLASLVFRLIVPSNHFVLPMGSSHKPPIQVYSGEVRIGKELNVIQRTMKEWFYTCAFLGTFVIMMAYGFSFLILRALFLKQMEKRKEAYRREQAAYGFRETWQYQENNGRWNNGGDMSDADWYAGEGNGAFRTSGRYSSAEESDGAEHEWHGTREGNTGGGFDNDSDGDSDEWDECSSIQFHSDDDNTTDNHDSDGSRNDGYQSGEHHPLAAEPERVGVEFDATGSGHENVELRGGDDDSSGWVESDGDQNQLESVTAEAPSNEWSVQQGFAKEDREESGRPSLKESIEAQHVESETLSIPSLAEVALQDKEREKPEIELLKTQSFDFGGVATEIKESQERVAGTGERAVEEDEAESSFKYLFGIGHFFGVILGQRAQTPTSNKENNPDKNPRKIPTDSVCAEDTEHEQTIQEMKLETIQPQQRNSHSVEATSFPAQQTGVGARSQRQDQENEQQPMRTPRDFPLLPPHEDKAANGTAEVKTNKSVRTGSERKKRGKLMKKNDSSRRQQVAQSRRAKKKVSRKQKEERILADRVMKGAFDAYEIFTDLDEPDPDQYG